MEEQIHGDDVVVEMMIASEMNPPPAAEGSAAAAEIQDEIRPLLSQSDKPKINIFSISYPRKKQPRVEIIYLYFYASLINYYTTSLHVFDLQDKLLRLAEVEISVVTQAAQWVWNGSRYSGLVCMALSSLVYCTMEVISDVFSGWHQSSFFISSLIFKDFLDIGIKI